MNCDKKIFSLLLNYWTNMEKMLDFTSGKRLVKMQQCDLESISHKQVYYKLHLQFPKFRQMLPIKNITSA